MANLKSRKKTASRPPSTRARTGPQPKTAEPRRKNADAAVAAATQPRLDTKQQRVIELLQREGGAAIADLVAATGWLPHTTRAALTRLRQRGHTILRSQDEAGRTVYRMAGTVRASRSRGAA
jgi:DNA-binding MarR family transcriptional regulator